MHLFCGVSQGPSPLISTMGHCTHQQKVYGYHTIILVFLFIINISISKAFENNTLCKDEAKSRVKRVINNFDPENVFLSVWGPKAISVQLTDQVGWNTFRIFGYLVGGKAPFIIDVIHIAVILNSTWPWGLKNSLQKQMLSQKRFSCN